MLSVKQNYVLVEPIDMAHKQVGSLIVVSEISDRNQLRGKVIAVGDGIMPNWPVDTVWPMDVKVGETVLFGREAGHTARMKHKNYIFLKEDDIIAVLED